MPHLRERRSAWLNDYKKAQEQAKANNKLLLLNFTGSDWCGWCIKFDKEVWSQPRFKDYARDNLVLLELDFPRRKDQPVEVKKQNLQLAQQYEVLGFPTIVVRQQQRPESCGSLTVTFPAARRRSSPNSKNCGTDNRATGR